MDFLNTFFGSSFLLNMSVIILFGGLFAYMNYRISVQDERITTLTQLVADEYEQLILAKKDIQGLKHQSNDKHIELPSHVFGHGLIDVSDNGTDQDDDDQDDDDQDDDDQDDDDQYDDDQDDKDCNNNIKIDNTTTYNLEILDEILDEIDESNSSDEIDESNSSDEIIKSNSSDEIIKSNSSDEIIKSNSSDEIKTIHLFNDTDFQILDTDVSIDINIIQQPIKEQVKSLDKMTINKLKEMALQLNLTTNPSKMKKPELIALIEKQL